MKVHVIGGGPAGIPGGGREEPLLLGPDVLGPRPAGSPHGPQRLGPGVIPVQVLVRDRAEGLQQVGAGVQPL